MTAIDWGRAGLLGCTALMALACGPGGEGSEAVESAAEIHVADPGGGVHYMGDVNWDWTIDSVDALLIARSAAGLLETPVMAGLADVNCDEQVDIVDALLVSQLGVGLISQYPCRVVSFLTPEGLQLVGSNGLRYGTAPEYSYPDVIVSGVGSDLYRLELNGLGMVGGYYDEQVDSGETVRFTFARPMTSVVLHLASYGPAGFSIAVVTAEGEILYGGSSSTTSSLVDVSDLTGHPRIVRVDYTVPAHTVHNGHRIGSISFSSTVVRSGPATVQRGFALSPP
jgi:hypothetical protein